MKKHYFILLAALVFSSLNAQIINFPDPNFKAKLLQASPSVEIAKNSNGTNIKIDTNNDSQIQVTEALAVYSLFVTNANITNLTGITSFANVTWLDCSSNLLTSLNLTGLNLGALNVCYNQLTALDVSGFPNMSFLGCCYNNLTSLDLSQMTHLGTIECSHNQITNINFPNSTADLAVYCNNNLITNIDFSVPNKVTLLNCSFNSLTNLDLSGCYKLETPPGQSYYSLDTRYNPTMISINVKNGLYTFFPWTSMPNLRYLCRDLVEDNAAYELYAPSTCVINSYCSFTPGGLFYTIQGASHYDFDNNGCDLNDPLMPRLNFAITNGAVIGNMIADFSGNYSIPVQAGTHTIAPVIENPTYFNVTPANVGITFPTAISPYTQDFCIAPNGTHHDLEVNILPLNAARPGFNSMYKITYKNKGTQTQSGSLSLSFNDDVMNLINVYPGFSSQTTNLLTWNFNDLLPFETKEIILELHLNSPTDVPPLTGGSGLIFTAAINGMTDETPSDNTFVLHQTLVNSFDPNDKTCLEGATITQAMVGKYVHYMIRFENTGTADAENIVVNDVIDAAKFDISSLVPIDGSHPFVTRISNTNKVEFIFKNINLPFDDANNDGYVAFKIKTKPTLVLGNTFSNTASIYFDYNFPIITNTATTSVALLANSDFEFSDYFKIYPNPVNDILNIETKKTIEVTSINIYNALGQLVLVIPNAQQTKLVDVSSLKTGNYFMKINSDKGSSSVKFMKL